LVRSWYSLAAAGSQFVGQMYQTGEPQVLSRRTQAGRAPDARARAEKPAGVRLRGRLLGRERLGRRGDVEVARLGAPKLPAHDEADRRIDDGVEATVGREADSPALPLALLVPVRPLTEGGASVEHELRLAARRTVIRGRLQLSSRFRSRSTSARRPVSSSQRKRACRPLGRTTSAMNASQVASRQQGSASAVPLGKVALEEYCETTLELPLASAGPVGQLEPS